MNQQQISGTFANTTGQMDQFAPSENQQGDGAAVETYTHGNPEAARSTPRAKANYQLLPFLGAISIHEKPENFEAVTTLSNLAGNDGAKLHKTALRPIGDSSRADCLAVFSGEFNAAQIQYLDSIRKVAIPATDPDLKSVQPWISQSRSTETEHSFARLAPD